MIFPTPKPKGCRGCLSSVALAVLTGVAAAAVVAALFVYLAA